MNEKKLSATFTATGTTWNIDCTDSISENEWNLIIVAVRERIETFEKTYSRFRPDSLISEMSKKAGKYRLPDDAESMLSLYREMFELTDGLVTPLIGQVLVDAGYDPEYTLHAKENIPSAKKWQEVLDYKHPILTLKQPAQLDFGAFGKGYIIDIVTELLKQRGLKKYTVDAGGDIAYRNESDSPNAHRAQPLRVGLENPDDFKQIIGVAEISNQSICGSSGNRRSWGKYHHIINPNTVESPRHIKSLWVVADSTLLADALSTALFFTTPEKMLQKYKFEYVIVYADGTAKASSGFPGSLFSI
jgi:thiamine biosynthesis lipoprotein